MSESIDGQQLRALLGAYLRMSLRGNAAGTFFPQRGKWRGIAALMLLYAVMGSVAAVGASGSGDPFSFALVMHTITFVMLGMSLAAESGDLLFHPGEHEILGHLALGPRALLVAKAASLMGFALLVAFAINLPSVVVGARLPWLPMPFLAVHLGAVVLLTAFAAGILVFSYGLVVRFVGRERFDNVAAWSQAGLSAAFLALSQGLAHLIELPILRLDAPFCLVFPPAWFAALDVMGAGIYSTRAAALSLFALGTTIALGWAALTRLAPGYGEAFTRLAEAHALSSPPAASRRAGTGLLRWWLRDPIERAAFQLAAAYMGRDREVKTRLYPSLGFIVLLPFAQLLGHGAHRFKAAAILAAIMIGLLPSIVLEALRVSSHHVAAELFVIAPVRSAGPLFRGVCKAVTCYVVLPAAAIAFLCVVLLEWRVLPLAVPSFLALPVMCLLPAVFRDYVPLSVPPTAGRQSLTNILIGMLVTVGGGAMVSVSWLVWRVGYWPHFVAAEIVAVTLGTRLLARRIATRPLRVAT